MESFKFYRYFFFCLFIVLPLQAWAGRYAFQTLSITNHTRYTCQLTDKSSNYTYAFISRRGNINTISPNEITMIDFYEKKGLKDLFKKKRNNLNATMAYQCGDQSVKMFLRVVDVSEYGGYIPFLDFISDPGIMMTSSVDQSYGYTFVNLYEK